MPPKNIVFDLDGTLVHSAPDLHLAINAMLSDLGRAPLSLGDVIGFIGNGVEKLVTRSLHAAGEVSDQGVHQGLGLFEQHYRENLTTLTRPYPGVVALLTQLQQAGVRLAVCTNKPEGLAREVCAQLEIAEYFEVITGAVEDVAKKPDPQALLNTIGAIGGSIGESLFVGDSEVDGETAQNAGVKFALFSGGYLKSQTLDFRTSCIFDDWREVDLNFRIAATPA